MSGSRGEANFVWRCKTCKVWLLWLQPCRMTLLTRPTAGKHGQYQERPSCLHSDFSTKANENFRNRLPWT